MNDEEMSCESCSADSSRRDFLRDSVAAAFGALMLLSGGNTAAAASIRWVEGMRRAAGTISYAIPAADGAQIDKANEVILVRWESNVYAFALSCPHQHTALRWHEEVARFQCPKHKSKYQPDGTFISGRATRAMDRFSLKRDGAAIVVDTNALHKSDKDPSGWAASVIRLGVS